MLQWRSNRSQGYGQPAHQRNIIVSHQRQILANHQPLLMGGSEHANRQLVIDGKQRARAMGLAENYHSLLLRMAAPFRFDPEPGLLHCPLKAFTPVKRIGGKIGTADQANITMA